MVLIRIGDLAETCGVTQRTLRYWEESGLIRSTRSEKGYRYFDEDNVKRVKEIQIMRFIGLSLEAIERILSHRDPNELAEALKELARRQKNRQKSLELMSLKLEALSQKVLFLNLQSKQNDQQSLVFEDALYAIKTSFTEALLSQPLIEPLNSKETMLPMIEQFVSETQETLNVRIVNLSPMRFAAYRAISNTPEDDCAKIINPMIEKHQLTERSYGFRHFGFNNPDPSEGSDIYGYEIWVSVPATLEIESPMWEVTFPGGLYASTTTTMGCIFENWQKLHKWVIDAQAYEAEFDPQNMRQWLEENIDYKHFYDDSVAFLQKQLDLLLPVKRL